MALRTCENSLQVWDCEGTCHTVCFACGMPACKPCSLVIPYYHYGRKRVCLGCLEDRMDDLKGGLNAEQINALRAAGLTGED